MRIQIVTHANTWFNGYVQTLAERLRDMGHAVASLHDVKRVEEGDLAFYLSGEDLVPRSILDRNTHNIVVHASDLPKGRGWAPWTWQILEGKNEIPLTLFEAEERVDSGRIYLQKTVRFRGDELVDELRAGIARVEMELCEEFVREYDRLIAQGREQEGEPTFYRRRLPEDSELDPGASIRDQFNLLRTVDNERFPAFFVLNGVKYLLRITKDKAEQPAGDHP